MNFSSKKSTSMLKWIFFGSTVMIIKKNKRKEVFLVTLQQLRYCIVVAEKGSISEAAKTLFVTQPSVTSAIHELEIEFKITIFNRTNRGMILSQEGVEFLSYARQVVEQAKLMEEAYLKKEEKKKRFQISAQHYSFVAEAFANLIQECGLEDYELTLRETKTSNIIDDVKQLRSEIGVLYLTEYNEKVLNRYLKENQLKFQELFLAKPHIFVGENHPLAKKEKIQLQELEEYPYLSYEQGEDNSFYFAEEMLSNVPKKKSIRVSDRATIFSLMIRLNGYTVSTGILGDDMKASNIIAKPVDSKQVVRVGIITHKKAVLSEIAKKYLEKLYELPMLHEMEQQGMIQEMKKK